MSPVRVQPVVRCVSLLCSTQSKEQGERKGRREGEGEGEGRVGGVGGVKGRKREGALGVIKVRRENKRRGQRGEKKQEKLTIPSEDHRVLIQVRPLVVPRDDGGPADADLHMC